MSWIFKGIKRNKKQPPVPSFRPLRMDRYILLIVKCSVRYLVSEEERPGVRVVSASEFRS